MAIAVTTAGKTRFIDWYQRNRARSAMLFDMLTPEAYESRPIPLRHPVRFYEGHLSAFSYITLVRDAAGKPSIDLELERLFYRGIDPASVDAAAHSAPERWPTREQVRLFGAKCDAAVVEMLEHADRDGKLSPRVREAMYTILEHEQMHHETLLYMLHRVPVDQKRRPAGTAGTPPDGPQRTQERVTIPAGTATLGAVRSETEFGWDNEFEALRVDVPAFEIDKYSVTNADYLRFVEAGGSPPAFWVRGTGEWRLTTMFEKIPLPLAWPAYVSQEQATAFARWRGMRLMTEPEFHRAAYATPSGEERPQPWGDAAPTSEHGNFDFENWDPIASGSRPAGASAWGVEDLVGNGWEWTSTEFGPLPGFKPMESYPAYSADFFDGAHFVTKGASPVTARELVRRSLRNWYRPNYPYIYAKFRCVAT
mgnify:CR=1 FL=1